MPTDNYLLFQMAEEKNTSVGNLLLGLTIPLTSMEFELYKEYLRVKSRLQWQQRNKDN